MRAESPSSMRGRARRAPRRASHAVRHGRVERRVDWSGDDGGRVDVEDGPRRDSDSANALCRRGAGASFKCLNGRHPRGGNAAAHRTLVGDVRVALGGRLRQAAAVRL